MNEVGDRIKPQLNQIVGEPDDRQVADSRHQVKAWFAETAPLLYWDTFDSPVGPLTAVRREAGLCGLRFESNPDLLLAEIDPLAHAVQSKEALADIQAELEAYFAGDRFEFDLPLDLSGVTVFQRNVLQAAGRIPAGVVWTYQQMAKALGKPKASRAVGQALAHNPIPIVIPCHRVVRTGGGLGGYIGGLERKRYLLDLEGAL